MCIYFVEMFPYSHTQALNDIQSCHNRSILIIQTKFISGVAILWNM